MPHYTPLNMSQINAVAGSYFPSQVKNYNNKSFGYWERALFQRATSVIKLNVPNEWEGEIKDFLYYCLFKYGYVAVFNSLEYGLSFQPCTLSGFDFYYQPTDAIILNPGYNAKLKIHDTCELIKLSPDYIGIWDIIEFYACKLSNLDNAIDMSIINNKVPLILGAKNKATAQTLKKIMDKVDSGEPLVIYDDLLEDDNKNTNKESSPLQIFDREHLKNSYVTSDQLLDWHTILSDFDNEVGIPTLPYQKKERLVEDEANSKVIESSTRATIWLETLNSSFKLVNEKFKTSLNAELRFNYNLGGDNNESIENNANRD